MILFEQGYNEGTAKKVSLARSMRTVNSGMQTDWSWIHSRQVEKLSTRRIQTGGIAGRSGDTLWVKSTICVSTYAIKLPSMHSADF